jgi:hypothetical protein
MPGRPRTRLTAYLVAPTTGRSSGATVYVVRTRSAAEALAAVQATLGQDETPVIVGSLSTRTAKAIGLKTGDVRPI